MIVSRKILDSEEHIDSIEYADICDGDIFHDKSGNWYSVSISDDGERISSVLFGAAHDAHIEPMSKLTIMEHFRDPKIMKWVDMPFVVDAWFWYWDRDRGWVKVLESAVNCESVFVIDTSGDELQLSPDTIVKII